MLTFFTEFFTFWYCRLLTPAAFRCECMIMLSIQLLCTGQTWDILYWGLTKHKLNQLMSTIWAKRHALLYSLYIGTHHYTFSGSGKLGGWGLGDVFWVVLFLLTFHRSALFSECHRLCSCNSNSSFFCKKNNTIFERWQANNS